MGVVTAVRGLVRFFLGLALAYGIGFSVTLWCIVGFGPWVGLWIPLGFWVAAMWLATRPPTSSAVALGILGGGLVGIGGGAMVGLFG